LFGIKVLGLIGKIFKFNNKGNWINQGFSTYVAHSIYHAFFY